MFSLGEKLWSSLTISCRNLASFRVGKSSPRTAGLVGSGILFQMSVTYCCATLLMRATLPSGVPAGRIEVQLVEDEALRQMGMGKIPCFIAEVGAAVLAAVVESVG